jgi:hypothetical protein
MQPTDNPEEPISEPSQTPAEPDAPQPMADITDSFLTPVNDLYAPDESQGAGESRPAYEASAPPPLVQPVIPEIMPEGTTPPKPPRQHISGVVVVIIVLVVLCCCCLISFVILWNIGDFLLTTLRDMLNSIFGSGIQIY